MNNVIDKLVLMDGLFIIIGVLFLILFCWVYYQIRLLRNSYDETWQYIMMFRAKYEKHDHSTKKPTRRNVKRVNTNKKYS